MLKFSRSNPCYSYHLFILKKPKLDSTERYLGLRNSYQSFELKNEVTKKKEKNLFFSCLIHISVTNIHVFVFPNYSNF